MSNSYFKGLFSFDESRIRNGKSGIGGTSKEIHLKMYVKPVKKYGGSVILLQWKRSGSEIY
jgi:hypothetical protein